MAVHLATQTRSLGNARFYSTYEDESHNRDLVTIIKSCHRADFCARVLVKMELMETWCTEDA
eukprot:9504411-Alexandrium_andersonii.AAC.1